MLSIKSGHKFEFPVFPLCTGADYLFSAMLPKFSGGDARSAICPPQYVGACTGFYR